MNRRNFLKNVLVGGASFAILPGAGRVWKATRDPRLVPFWIETTPFSSFVSKEYQAYMEKLFLDHFVWGATLPDGATKPWNKLELCWNP